MHKALLILCLAFTQLAWSHSELEAKSSPELVKKIDEATFAYTETGKMFGFVSTESCMYVSQDIVVFRNYCYPVRNYPAQGYTIITKEFGVIELYEEDAGSILKRDITITHFPSHLAPYVNSPLPALALKDYSLILEKLYPRYLPGCWSTNHSFYSERKEANCSTDTATVIGFPQWAQETQFIVGEEDQWKSLMKSLNEKFKRR